MQTNRRREIINEELKDEIPLMIGNNSREETKYNDSNPTKTKEIIQTAMNLMNGIAFGSHSTRFQYSGINNRNPGPGQYNIVQARGPLKLDPIVYVPIKSCIDKFEETQNSPGPGEYFKDIEPMTKCNYNGKITNRKLDKSKDDKRKYYFDFC